MASLPGIAKTHSCINLYGFSALCNPHNLNRYEFVCSYVSKQLASRSRCDLLNCLSFSFFFFLEKPFFDPSNQNKRKSFSFLAVKDLQSVQHLLKTHIRTPMPWPCGPRYSVSWCWFHSNTRRIQSTVALVWRAAVLLLTILIQINLIVS